jgi:hypothetical protein
MRKPHVPTRREQHERLELEAMTRCNWIRARLMSDPGVYSEVDCRYFASRLLKWERVLASVRRLLNASSVVEISVHGADLFAQPAEAVAA